GAGFCAGGPGAGGCGGAVQRGGPPVPAPAPGASIDRRVRAAVLWVSCGRAAWLASEPMEASTTHSAARGAILTTLAVLMGLLALSNLGLFAHNVPAPARTDNAFGFTYGAVALGVSCGGAFYLLSNRARLR